jgi:hypothetical protein
MEDVKIILSGLWIATALCYLLGDVIRIFSGATEPGKIEGKTVSQGMWLGIAMIMIIPIIMVVLSLILENQANRLVNLIVAIFFIIFNLLGIKGYKLFDKFLLFVSFVFNSLVIYYASTP